MESLALGPLRRAAGTVRLPGSKRFGTQKRLRIEGIEIPDDLLGKIEKLCTT